MAEEITKKNDVFLHPDDQQQHDPFSKENSNRTLRERRCSVSTDAAINTVVQTSIMIENSGKTDIGGLHLPPDKPENRPPSVVMNENFAIEINGPTTVETDGRMPTINVINHGPIIQFSDEMMQSFRRDGTLDKMLDKIYQLSIQMSDNSTSTTSGAYSAQNESSVNYTRQKSLRSRETHSRIKIEDKGTRVTLAFSPLDKNYSLTSSKPRCDWEKFMSPKYRCLSRAVLTVFVVFLTFLTIYVITIYGFKFTEDK